MTGVQTCALPISGSTAPHAGAHRSRLVKAPLGERDAHIEAAALVTRKLSLPRRTGHFVLHYLEMCAPMCVGFAVGDLIYFWAAGLFGYSEPFRQLPELSMMVVTFTMTAPMVAWMLFRGMPRRETTEIYTRRNTLSLHDALPISASMCASRSPSGALTRRDR